MKPTPARPNHQRIFLISLSLALVIIGLGSALAMLGRIPSWTTVGNALLTPFEWLTNSNLVIKTDHTKLAANGASQTLITASHPKLGNSLTAEVVEGGGTIIKNDQTETSAKFTYTSGTRVGLVTIAIHARSITETIQIELLEPTAPAAPQIVSPPTNTSTNLLKPEIIGTGPANTKIVVSNNGQINATTKTDKDGAFRVKLERALGNGQQTITAVAVSDLDIPSPASSPIIINVQAEPLKFDSANIRFSPAKIIAGNSFAVFIPASLNTEKVLVELGGNSYELKDTNEVSIFSQTLPAPNEPGSYAANIILVDAADIPTKFENALKFTVGTP